MKKQTDEVQKQQLIKAKQSQKDWTKVARTWEYSEIAALIKSPDPCRAIIERMKSKGFFVVNDPAHSTADASLFDVCGENCSFTTSPAFIEPRRSSWAWSIHPTQEEVV